MVLRSSDREKPLPGARINLGPTPTATTSSTGETKAGRRGRILHLGPPDPAPIPPPRRPDPRSTLAKQRERKPPPPPPRAPAPSRTAAAPAPTAPKVPAAPAPKVRQRFDLPTFTGQVRQIEVLRTRLRREIEEHERQIREAERALERRDWPVIGLLTRRSQEALEEQLSTLVDNLDAVYSQLLDAAVEADFDIDARAQALFAELSRRFDGLRPVAAAQDSAGTARRAAAPRDDQLQSRLTQPALDLITCPTRPLRLHHGREKELFIFPWFVAVVGRVGGCGLHDIRDLFVSMRAAATGAAGELLVTLPTGFDEAYRFSSAAACDAFVDAFAAYLEALPPPAPVIATPAADRRPPSGAQPPVPTTPGPASKPVAAAADKPPAPDTRSAPPELKLASISPAATPSSGREAAVASTPAPPAPVRPIPAEIRLIPLPRGLLPAADDPFAAPQARTENAAAPSSAPAPISPAVEAPAPLAANDSTEPASTVVLTAATEAPAPAPEIPAPLPAIDVAVPTTREPEASPTVEREATQPPLATVATTSAPAAASPAVEKIAKPEEPIASPVPAPDVDQTAERDTHQPTLDAVTLVSTAPVVEQTADVSSPMPAPDADPAVKHDAHRPELDAPAMVVPTTPVAPVLEQAAEVAPPTPAAAANPMVDTHQPPVDAETIAPDSPAIDPIALAETPEAPTVPTPDVSPVMEQDTLPPTRDSAALSTAIPEDAVPATQPADIAIDRPRESAAPDDDLRPVPDAALPPIAIRWDTAVPLAPAASPPRAPQRDDPAHPSPSPHATPTRPWREPNADDSAAHWSEPLSRLHIPVWPPIEAPPASHRTPLDEEAAQHWSEPVSLIQVPAWPPLDGSPASTAKLPPGASIKLSAAARSAVDAVVASSRAHLHTSARVGAAGLAAVTTYIGDVRTSAANRRQQRQVAPAEAPSVRIRPSGLSVPLPVTSLLGNRTWRWAAALTVIAIAIAATSPFLWRQHSEPTVAASPPPLPPLPPSPPAPGSAPAAPALPAAAASQPKAEIPSPPRPAPRESRPLSGVEIAQLQGRLRTLGFNPGPADGVIGPRTVTAAREFQAAHGLTVTGAIDSALFDDVSVAQAKTMKPPGTP